MSVPFMLMLSFRFNWFHVVSTVPTFSVDVLINEKHPYNEQGALKKLYLIKPVKDFRRLTLQFALPDQHVNWRFKPHSYFTHLLGHEGVGSILSLLKEKGWATALSAGCSGYAEGFDLLSIGIELTLNGLGKSYQFYQASC